MSEKSKVLVVDDEKSTRLFLQSVLAKHNYHIVLAESGQAALDVLADDPDFDVILLDFLMVGLNGIEVLKEIKLKDEIRNIRVIIISGLYEPDDMVEAYSSGAADYIIKPFDAAELLARIETQVRLKAIHS